MLSHPDSASPPPVKDEELIERFLVLRGEILGVLDTKRNTLRVNLVRISSAIVVHFFVMATFYFLLGAFVFISYVLMLVHPWLVTLPETIIIQPFLRIFIAAVVLAVWIFYWVGIHTVVFLTVHWRATLLGFTLLIMPLVFWGLIYALDEGQRRLWFTHYWSWVAISLSILIAVCTLLFIPNGLLSRSMFFLLTMSYLPHWLPVIPKREYLLLACRARTHQIITPLELVQLQLLTTLVRQRVEHTNAQIQTLGILNGLLGLFALIGLVLSSTQITQLLNMAMQPIGPTLPSSAATPTISGGTFFAVIILGGIAGGIFLILVVMQRVVVLGYCNCAAL